LSRVRESSADDAIDVALRTLIVVKAKTSSSLEITEFLARPISRGNGIAGNTCHEKRMILSLAHFLSYIFVQ
jgi:hypothetical protein